jgi:hypothetical protein
MDEEFEGTNEEEVAELPETTPEEQSKDKDNPMNHAFASITRENKQLKAKQDAWNQKVATWAQQAGFEDIRDIDGYLAAVERQRQEAEQAQLAQQYQTTQDPAILAKISANQVMQNPELSKRFNQMDNIVDYVVSQQANQMAQQQIADLNTRFGTNIKDINEVKNLPNGNKIVDYVAKKGLSLAEAYVLANQDDVMKNATAAEKQRMVNQARGYDHVNADARGGNVDSIQVTEADIREWKGWFPDKTTDQCIKEIRAAKKNGDM